MSTAPVKVTAPWGVARNRGSLWLVLDGEGAPVGHRLAADESGEARVFAVSGVSLLAAADGSRLFELPQGCAADGDVVRRWLKAGRPNASAKSGRAVGRGQGPAPHPDRIDWDRVFRLRCDSKRGVSLPPGALDELRGAFDADPERYSSLDERVFRATAPFGSAVGE